jgi:hypothetical protein
MEEPSLLPSLLPGFVATVIFFFFAIPISRRKGKGVGFAAWCLVPFIAPFIPFFLVSLTNKSVLDRLAALEGKTS